MIVSVCLASGGIRSNHGRFASWWHSVNFAGALCLDGLSDPAGVLCLDGRSLYPALCVVDPCGAVICSDCVILASVPRFGPCPFRSLPAFPARLPAFPALTASESSESDHTRQRHQRRPVTTHSHQKRCSKKEADPGNPVSESA